MLSRVLQMLYLTDKIDRCSLLEFRDQSEQSHALLTHLTQVQVQYQYSRRVLSFIFRFESFIRLFRRYISRELYLISIFAQNSNQIKIVY